MDIAKIEITSYLDSDGDFALRVHVTGSDNLTLRSVEVLGMLAAAKYWFLSEKGVSGYGD